MDPAALFRMASPSIVIVEALDLEGAIVAQGSGVVIGRDLVVSNRHVVERATTVRVSREGQKWPAEIIHVSEEHDLVQLVVAGLDRPALPMRLSSTLSVGERVYAIGAPQGLELSLSDGLISSLRKSDTGFIIQTTAPISPGSSGGGLFDAAGKLIGITSFQVKGGQNLNFAVPMEAITVLQQHSATSENQPRFVTRRTAAQLVNAGKAFVIAKDPGSALPDLTLAVKTDPEYPLAWYWLGRAYSLAKRAADALVAYREVLRLQARHGTGSGINISVMDLRDDAWTAIGLDYVGAKDWTAAEEAFNEAVKLNARYAGAWKGLGQVGIYSHRYDLALRGYRTAIDLNPSDAEAWLGAASAHLMRREGPEARRAYSELQRLDPTRAAAFYKIAGPELERLR